MTEHFEIHDDCLCLMHGDEMYDAVDLVCLQRTVRQLHAWLLEYECDPLAAFELLDQYFAQRPPIADA